MRIINTHEAKTHLSQLINDVLAGEDIIIARSGKRLVKIIPYKPSQKPRRGGQLSGLISINDDFDAPLPQSIEDAFYKED